MARLLKEWNEYLETVKRLKDTIYAGTKNTEGLNLHLEMEDCDVIWELLSSEASAVYSTPLDFARRNKA